MQRDLARLSRQWPLPPGWSNPQLFADEVTLGALRVRRTGVLSRRADGVEATGSAAETGGSPLSRAWFELLERAVLLDASGRRCPVLDLDERCIAEVPAGTPSASNDPRRRPARSNGVALHRSWRDACEGARLELLERDRVLRSWYGELPLIETAPPAWLEQTEAHEWRAAFVAPREGEPTPSDAVAVVVGLPTRPEVPLARGFAARSSPDAALEAAASEALQGLAFLWDEPVPDRCPELEPTPTYHLDYYLCPDHHERLRRWLQGAHVGIGVTDEEPITSRLGYVDLTPAGLGEGLRVARALDPGARELVFGEPPEPLATRLPEPLRVHPIP